MYVDIFDTKNSKPLTSDYDYDCTTLMKNAGSTYIIFF